MKKLAKYWILPLLILPLLTSCWSARESGKKAKGSSQRIEIHKHGIIIEAKYDPRLDNLIPGYKMITVALTNNGHDVLRLNPLRDKWEIVDAFGRNQKAINSLRIKDPHTFSRLPAKVQQLVEYPVGVSVGYSETVDLFFPKHQELSAFRSISFYSSDRKMKYDVLTNMDSPTHIPINPKKDGQAKVDPRFAK